MASNVSSVESPIAEIPMPYAATQVYPINPSTKQAQGLPEPLIGGSVVSKISGVAAVGEKDKTYDREVLSKRMGTATSTLVAQTATDLCTGRVPVAHEPTSWFGVSSGAVFGGAQTAHVQGGLSRNRQEPTDISLLGVSRSAAAGGSVAQASRRISQSSQSNQTNAHSAENPRSKISTPDGESMQMPYAPIPRGYARAFVDEHEITMAPTPSELVNTRGVRVMVGEELTGPDLATFRPIQNNMKEEDDGGLDNGDTLTHLQGSSRTLAAPGKIETNAVTNSSRGREESRQEHQVRNFASGLTAMEVGTRNKDTGGDESMNATWVARRAMCGAHNPRVNDGNTTKSAAGGHDWFGHGSRASAGMLQHPTSDAPQRTGAKGHEPQPNSVLNQTEHPAQESTPLRSDATVSQMNRILEGPVCGGGASSGNAQKRPCDGTRGRVSSIWPGPAWMPPPMVHTGLHLLQLPTEQTRVPQSESAPTFGISKSMGAHMIPTGNVSSKTKPLFSYTPGPKLIQNGMHDANQIQPESSTCQQLETRSGVHFFHRSYDSLTSNLTRQRKHTGIQSD
jgi:hypothetical protein